MKLKNAYFLVLGLSFGVYAHAANDIDQQTSQYIEGLTYDEAIKMQEKVDTVQALQLNRDQVAGLKKSLLEQEKSRSTPYPTTAIPVTRSLNIKFDAGLTPPIVRLSANMLTTLVFSDGVGNPWDIQSVSLNGKFFKVNGDYSSSNEKNENAETSIVKNILSIEPLSATAYSNVIVTLEGLDKPVILMLTTGQAEVDMRVDARVSGVNPNRVAKTTNASTIGATSTLDDAALLFVDGTPPEAAQLMKTSKRDVDAWLYEDEIIVRTRNTVIYPAFKSSSMSASGMSVYRFDADVSDVIISDNYGKPQTIHIELQ